MHIIFKMGLMKSQIIASSYTWCYLTTILSWDYP